jgi:hypothetical protein
MPLPDWPVTVQPDAVPPTPKSVVASPLTGSSKTRSHVAVVPQVLLYVNEETEGAVVSVTVTTNVSVAVWPPSETVSVIVVVPAAFGRGVTVTSRFAPEPPMAMSAFATIVWSDEAPVTTSEPAAVSTSPTVKASGPSTEALSVDWSAIALIVGVASLKVTVDVAVTAANVVLLPYSRRVFAVVSRASCQR